MISKITRSLIDVKHNNLFTIAFKMLVNSKRKFIGMVIGATFSAFIIMQQPSVYQGIKDRLVAPIQAITTIDLWVMGENSFDFSDPIHFNPMDIYRIRSIPGVLWAKQIYRFFYTMDHLDTKKTATWELIGVDSKSLLGLPKTMIAGNYSSINKAHSIIIDGYSLKQLETPGKKKIQLGDKMIAGQYTWTVTAISKPLRTYMINPKMYMASSNIPDITHKPSFILVKLKSSFDINQIAKEIYNKTHFIALTPSQFINRASEYYLHRTPVVVVFIVIAIIGYCIGLIIMWQIFSNFVLTHLHQFGMLKMLGVSSSSLIKMVLFQAAITSGIGFIVGFIFTVLFGLFSHDTTIPFHLTWKITLLGLLGSTLVVIFSSYFAILKVLRLDTVELCRDTN